MTPSMEFILLATLLPHAQMRLRSASTNGILEQDVPWSEQSLLRNTNLLFEYERTEGLSFLTKKLPSLGKGLDKALSMQIHFSAADYGFKPMVLPATDSRPETVTALPEFLFEEFERVLHIDGGVREDADKWSVALIRQICYLYYKYDCPYSHEQEQRVLNEFERTEEELKEQSVAGQLSPCDSRITAIDRRRRRSARESGSAYLPAKAEVVRAAQDLLEKVFLGFNPRDITPAHGPGAVSTKERLWEKYVWSNVADCTSQYYPVDEYYFVSMGHVCDRIQELNALTSKSNPAQVILVPKDSRGPRLISCEPVDKQWVQQGLSRAIVQHVERHSLTRDHVHFTDQSRNQYAALHASKDGAYATLDLKEASDRVSTDLVRLLFPRHMVEALIACRSSCTKLPDGRVLVLEKYAPMGSALCFPIMALSIWAILSAAAPDRHTSDRMLVYGDDVIVKTQYASCAIEQLESFGLKVNRDKSCTSGFFRESCGMDAFNGLRVTPVRIKTVWSSRRSAAVLSSWVAYANQFLERGFRSTYLYMVGLLYRVYGQIPDSDMHLACPSLTWIPEFMRPTVRRWNKHLQKCEYKVWTVASPPMYKEIDGWSMLLRFLTEAQKQRLHGDMPWVDHDLGLPLPYEGRDRFEVRKYTPRRRSMLRRRWRGA